MNTSVLPPYLEERIKSGVGFSTAISALPPAGFTQSATAIGALMKDIGVQAGKVGGLIQTFAAVDLGLKLMGLRSTPDARAEQDRSGPSTSL